MLRYIVSVWIVELHMHHAVPLRAAPLRLGCILHFELLFKNILHRPSRHQSTLARARDAGASGVTVSLSGVACRCRVSLSGER